jgi:hypothetical protein
MNVNLDYIMYLPPESINSVAHGKCGGVISEPQHHVLLSR